MQFLTRNQLADNYYLFSGTNLCFVCCIILLLLFVNEKHVRLLVVNFILFKVVVTSVNAANVTSDDVNDMKVLSADVAMVLSVSFSNVKSCEVFAFYNTIWY